MKYILAIVFIFLSAHSFSANTNLKGKGLLCNSIDKSEPRPVAFSFLEYGFKKSIIEQENDRFYITTGEWTKFYTDKNYITLIGNIRGVNTSRVNRKTLVWEVYSKSRKGYVYKGNCKVYAHSIDMVKEYREIKDKYQKEYNKSLEGNKI